MSGIILPPLTQSQNYPDRASKPIQLPNIKTQKEKQNETSLTTPSATFTTTTTTAATTPSMLAPISTLSKNQTKPTNKISSKQPMTAKSTPSVQQPNFKKLKPTHVIEEEEAVIFYLKAEIPLQQINMPYVKTSIKATVYHLKKFITLKLGHIKVEQVEVMTTMGETPSNDETLGSLALQSSDPSLTFIYRVKPM